MRSMGKILGTRISVQLGRVVRDEYGYSGLQMVRVRMWVELGVCRRRKDRARGCHSILVVVRIGLVRDW